MNATFNWYILHTKNNGEIKLAQSLSRKGYETYCPQYTQPQKWHLQKKLFQQALFSSWVFVRCTQEQLAGIKKFGSSVKLVYRFDKPAVVQAEEISMIRYVLHHFTEVKPVKTNFESKSIEIEEENEKTSFTLPSLGFVLIAHAKIQQQEAYLPVIEDGNLLQLTGLPKKGQRTLALLRRLSFLFTGKGLKPSSLMQEATQ